MPLSNLVSDLAIRHELKIQCEKWNKHKNLYYMLKNIRNYSQKLRFKSLSTSFIPCRKKPRRRINCLLYVETARQAACCVEEYCFNRYSAIPIFEI